MPCLGAMSLQHLCPVTQHLTRAFGHPVAGSGMQVPGMKAMASRWERYRQVIKKPSKHTLAQVSVKVETANPLHHWKFCF